MSEVFSSAPAISYEYKLGVKREVIDALRDALATWPDDQLTSPVHVVNEYPVREIAYPMILVKFIEQDIRNIGIGHVERGTNNDGTPYQLLHWQFSGSLQFKIYGRDPLERDIVASGLLNLLAFGSAIPEFQKFSEDINDYDFVAIQLLTDKITPGGDSNESPPWGNPDDMLFTTTYSVQMMGEFFTNPRTGGLVVISRVVAYPYRAGAAVPVGSQAHDATHDDRTVPWRP
jgi:hypothetical protein